MYRTGHYGAALTVYAPLGGALLATGFEVAAVAGGAVALALAGFPDVDQRIPFVDHRGVTHTVWFALLVGAVLGGVGAAVGGGPGSEARLAAGTLGFVVATLAILSHLLADALTPMGIRPFWPVSGAHYTLSLVRADNAVANYLLLAVGVAGTVCVLLVAGG